MPIKYLIVVVMFSFCLIGNCFADVQENTDAQKIKEKILKDFQINFPLLIKPIPELQEEVLLLKSLQQNLINTTISQYRFYGVKPSFFEIKEGKIVSQAINLDSDYYWIVCIEGDNSPYFLAGFPDFLTDFNRLVSGIKFEVKDKETVIDIFDFYLKLISPLQQRASIVNDEMKLQSLALEDFRSRYTVKLRQKKYSVWWQSMSSKLLKSISEPKVSEQDNRFKVTYFRYDKENVYEESILISPQGEVLILASKILH
jgi:hypothetical protein